MKIILSIVYIVLTIWKLFTARLALRIEEAPLIVLKAVPTLGNNVIKSGEDQWIAQNWIKSSWYEQGKYIRLFSTNGSSFWIGVYDILILIWWISTICIIVYLGYMLFQYIFKRL